MGSSQSSGPISVPLNIRCHNITYNQKGLITLRTTVMSGFRPVTFKLRDGEVSAAIRALNLDCSQDYGPLSVTRYITAPNIYGYQMRS